MKYSLIITTKNEERSIGRLLDSVKRQTKKPSEIIIADAGSSDSTRKIINSYKKTLPIKLLSLPELANRSMGRNRAIAKANTDLILITDAGCVLERTWVAEIIKPFVRKETDVVAGYYRGEGKNVFEQCQIPYVLVMPDRYDAENFLPATRSMAMRKQVWKEMGGFNEKYRYAEDYIFARFLKAKGYRIDTAPRAIVTWRPRPSLASFARMIGEHARGDAYNGAWRMKVLFIFLRYLVFMSLFLFGLFNMLLILLALYLHYAVRKNYRYVYSPKAILYLPLLQLTSDLMVMWETIYGLALRCLRK